MTQDRPPETIEELKRISAPARLCLGEDIEPNCWPMAQQMLDIWKDKRDGEKAPARADLKPAEIGEALPYLSIFDVSYVPFTLTCRLMGSAFVNAIGYDATGNSTNVYASTEALKQRAEWVCSNIEPMLLIGLPLVWSPKKNYKTYDTLTLPFMGEGGTVDAILYLNQFHNS